MFSVDFNFDERSRELFDFSEEEIEVLKKSLIELTNKLVKIENIELVVSGENVVYFSGKVLTSRELRKLLKQAAKRKQSILIKADKRASLGRVVEIWDKSRDLGVAQINIATNQE